jgi:fermentation-respiration switch protein FrsA (DUF1100 family)
MRIAAGVLSVASLATGCRDSIERGLIYYPVRELAGDPGRVGLTFRDVSFRAADGVRLHGWLVPGRVATTLLWCHGNAGNISHRLENIRLFVDELGVGVFIFDYRGYGRSEGAPTEPGLVQDALAARAALLGQGGVASNRIVYFGRSLGAAVALDLALAHPPEALVLETPFLSVRAMANRTLPGSGYLFRTQWDSLVKIPRLRAPLLILHGDADEVVPYAHGRDLFAAAPEPKAFYTIAGAHHNDTYLAGPAYWDAWRRFLGARVPLAPTVRGVR